MTHPRLSRSPDVPSNNTVKLPTVLQGRIARAMVAEGYTVWAEFCRVALTEKCQFTERRLRTTDPTAYGAIYGINAVPA